MKRITTLLLLLISLTVLGQSNKNTKFFRQLRYNHVSPHVALKGIHEITKNEAQNTSHYVFDFDNEGKITRIINNHYFSQRPHPLATIGAYKTIIAYTENSEIRTFYDPNGKPITNARGVYKEKYVLDKKGFKTALQFLDLENKPMESGWKVAKYTWEKKKKLVIERRFNLKEEAVNVSPYFPFGITGIAYNKDGSPKAHYNLNEDLKIQEDTTGIAVYKDTYDENGNHVKYTYHDKNEELANNKWGFATGYKMYDEFGNYIARKTLDKNGELRVNQKIPSNLNIKVAKPASQMDSLQIKEKALGYLVALQQLRPQLMEDVMHEDLAKRTIGFDFKEKKENIRETTYDQMIGFAESWNKSGTKFPFNPNNKVIILDIYDHTASVKLVSDNWVEYLHLIKTNKEWKIINLLWQHKDVSRYGN